MAQIEDDLDFGVTLDNDDQTDRNIGKDGGKAGKKLLENPQKDKENIEGISMKASDYNISNASHPVACVFSVLFKGLAFFMYFILHTRYLVLGNFISSVLTFIFVTIFMASDFWVIKNVSGRLLVGLRWWSSFDEKGKEMWRFESKDNEGGNSVDSSVFWMGQIICVLLWGFFLVVNALSFDMFWVFLLLKIGFS